MTACGVCVSVRDVRFRWYGVVRVRCVSCVGCGRGEGERRMGGKGREKGEGREKGGGGKGYIYPAAL